MLGHATFSVCERFRYRLWRTWGPGLPLLFVMLNPSTADARSDDPTLRRCLGFAQRAGFGALEVVNLFAYRATDPRDLRAAGYPVGPRNDEHIAAAVGDSAAVCLAWGSNATRLARPAEVLGLLRGLRARPQCLRLTRDGCPQHPLRLPAGCGLRPFPIEGDRGGPWGAAAQGTAMLDDRSFEKPRRDQPVDRPDLIVPIRPR